MTNTMKSNASKSASLASSSSRSNGEEFQQSRQVVPCFASVSLVELQERALWHESQQQRQRPQPQHPLQLATPPSRPSTSPQGERAQNLHLISVIEEALRIVNEPLRG